MTIIRLLLNDLLSHWIFCGILTSFPEKKVVTSKKAVTNAKEKCVGLFDIYDSVQPPEVDTPLKSLPYLFSSLSRANLTFHHLAVGNFTIIVFLLKDKNRQNALQTGKIHIKNIFSCIVLGFALLPVLSLTKY